MQNFLPWHGLLGGALIGLAAGFYLLVAGRIAGISGILEEAITPSASGWRLAVAFVLGLPLGALLVARIAPQLVPAVNIAGGTALIIAGGLLVGLGARIGGGCTSGHGVCGLPRFSARAIVATLTFMGSAAATVLVARHLV